jgi:hypothetical protein
LKNPPPPRGISADATWGKIGKKGRREKQGKTKDKGRNEKGKILIKLSNKCKRGKNYGKTEE